jgi:hypothetical protein
MGAKKFLLHKLSFFSKKIFNEKRASGFLRRYRVACCPVPADVAPSRAGLLTNTKAMKNEQLIWNTLEAVAVRQAMGLLISQAEAHPEPDEAYRAMLTFFRAIFTKYDKLVTKYRLSEDEYGNLTVSDVLRRFDVN